MRMLRVAPAHEDAQEHEGVAEEGLRADAAASQHEEASLHEQDEAAEEDRQGGVGVERWTAGRGPVHEGEDLEEGHGEGHGHENGDPGSRAKRAVEHPLREAHDRRRGQEEGTVEAGHEEGCGVDGACRRGAKEHEHVQGEQRQGQPRREPRARRRASNPGGARPPRRRRRGPWPAGPGPSA